MKTIITIFFSALLVYSCTVSHEHVHHHMNHQEHHDHDVKTQFLTLKSKQKPEERFKDPFKKVNVGEFERGNRKDFDYYIFNDEVNNGNLGKKIEYTSHLFVKNNVDEESLIEVLCPYNQDLEGTHHNEPTDDILAGKLGCIGYIPWEYNLAGIKTPIVRDNVIYLPCFSHFQTTGTFGFVGKLAYSGEDKDEIINAFDDGRTSGFVNIEFKNLYLEDGVYNISGLEIKP